MKKKKEGAENYNLYIKNELQKESFCENDDLGTYSTDSLGDTHFGAHMETTTSTDPPALHYLAAITQILHRTDWQSVVLGDFYLSRDQLVYIYYGGFKSSSAVAGGTAALLGGVTGAIANAWTDGAVRDAMPYYTASLRKSWA